MLAAAAGAAQHAVSRFDSLDDPVIVIGHSEQDLVAGRDDVALIGRQGLQNPPRGAL